VGAATAASAEVCEAASRPTPESSAASTSDRSPAPATARARTAGDTPGSSTRAAPGGRPRPCQVSYPNYSYTRSERGGPAGPSCERRWGASPGPGERAPTGAREARAGGAVMARRCMEGASLPVKQLLGRLFVRLRRGTIIVTVVGRANHLESLETRPLERPTLPTFPARRHTPFLGPRGPRPPRVRRPLWPWPQSSSPPAFPERGLPREGARRPGASP